MIKIYFATLVLVHQCRSLTDEVNCLQFSCTVQLAKKDLLGLRFKVLNLQMLVREFWSILDTRNNTLICLIFCLFYFQKHKLWTDLLDNETVLS